MGLNGDFMGGPWCTQQDSQLPALSQHTTSGNKGKHSSNRSSQPSSIHPPETGKEPFLSVCARELTCPKHSLAKSGTPVGRPVAFLVQTSIGFGLDSRKLLGALRRIGVGHSSWTNYPHGDCRSKSRAGSLSLTNLATYDWWQRIAAIAAHPTAATGDDNKQRTERTVIHSRPPCIEKCKPDSSLG